MNSLEPRLPPNWMELLTCDDFRMPTTFASTTVGESSWLESRTLLSSILMVWWSNFREGDPALVQKTLQRLIERLPLSV